jgi:hypothetical protein
MALRLILVSLVAGLGLTLPTGGQLSALKETAHKWVSARLAEWDAQMPADESAFVFVADSAPRAAETAAVPTPAPAPSNQVPAADVAARTDRHADERIPASSPSPSPDVVAGLLAPTAPSALFEEEFGFDLLTLDGDGTAPTVSDEPAVEAPFVPECCRHVERSPARALEACTVAIAPAAAPVKTAGPRFDPIEISDDLYPGVAYALNREAEGVSPESALTATPNPKSRNQFEPMEVADDLYSGFAYALNREADGLNLPSPSVSKALTSTGTEEFDRASEAKLFELQTGDRLTRAVRLTREAVVAWASLLHGPAVVTIAD